MDREYLINKYQSKIKNYIKHNKFNYENIDQKITDS